MNVGGLFLASHSTACQKGRAGGQRRDEEDIMHMEKRRKNLRAQESPLAVVYKSQHLFAGEREKNLVHSIAKKEVVVNGPRPLTRGRVIFFFSRNIV